MEEAAFLIERQSKPGPMQGLTGDVANYKRAATEPRKSSNSEKKSQSQQGQQEQQMTEGTFLLYATEGNRSRRHLPAIDCLNRSLTKERKEGTRLQDLCTKDSGTLSQGFALEERAYGPKASTGTRMGPGWRCGHSSPPASQRSY